MATRSSTTPSASASTSITCKRPLRRRRTRATSERPADGTRRQRAARGSHGAAPVPARDRRVSALGPAQPAGEGALQAPGSPVRGAERALRAPGGFTAREAGPDGAGPAPLARAQPLRNLVSLRAQVRRARAVAPVFGCRAGRGQPAYWGV